MGNWHEISDLINCGRKIEIDTEYPFWIKIENAPYPVNIAAFYRFRHQHTIKDTGLSDKILDRIYQVAAILNGGDHSIVLLEMERNKCSI